MVRVYRKKNNRTKTYTEEDMNHALRAVKECSLSQKDAADTFNVPRSTLQIHLKSYKNRNQAVGFKAGRKTALHEDMEKAIANSIKIMGKWGFGLTKVDFLNTMQTYLSVNKIKTPFKDNKPGTDWLLSFRKRHSISLKMPETKQGARFEQFTPDIVLPFYDLLSNEIRTNNLANKPHLIFNMDETGFPHDPSKVKVLGETGASLYRRTKGTGRGSTTVLACVSASGQVFPPHFLFKSASCTVRRDWRSEKAYPGTSYDASIGGWMTSQAFFHYMTNYFVKWAPKERPLLVIFDGHLSHISIEVVNFAIENKIDIIRLPAHTTDNLQPLDKVAFRPLKNSYNRYLIEWQRQNYGEVLHKSDLVEIVGKAWNALTVENIKKGFQSTGIFDPDSEFPVNPQKIEKMFAPHDLVKYKERLSNVTELETNIYVAVDDEGENNVPEPNNHTPSRNGNDNDAVSGPSSRKSPLPSIPNTSDNIVPVLLDSPINLVPEPTPSFINFEELLLQKITRLKSVSSRRDTSSGAVITSPGFVQTLQEKKKKKDDKLQKKENVLKKKGNVQENKKQKKNRQESESDISYHDESDEDFEGYLRNLEAEKEEEQMERDLLDEEIKLGDFILVKFCTKKNVKYFIGQVKQVNEFKDEFTIKFLRQGKNESFVWPQVDDVSIVGQHDIERKLPPPINTRRDIFKFSVSFEGYQMG